MDLFHELVGRGSNGLLWWQMCVRALLVFLFAVLLFRFAPRRSFGRSTVFDIVLAVVLGSMLSRTLTGNAPLLPTFAAAAALVVLHALFAQLAFAWEPFGKAVKGRKTQLVRDGRLDRAAMRRTAVTCDDLREALRSARGHERLERIEAAYLERSGRISIVERPEER
mgnify:CR=1 FL=1